MTLSPFPVPAPPRATQDPSRDPSPTPLPLPALDAAGSGSENPSSRRAPAPPLPTAPDTPEFTDDDLREVMAGLTPPATASTAVIPDFQPALRANLREILAQHTRGPFDDPDFLQRLGWRFNALVTSRSYEEILHDKTRRFRVEECLLFDLPGLGLVSHASTNPGRHADARKIHATADRVALRLRDLPENQSAFAFDKSLTAKVTRPPALILVTFVRGPADPQIDEDLDFILREIAANFAAAIADGRPLMNELQPRLENCLLLRAPLAPGG
jgi:hypothetical protein